MKSFNETMGALYVDYFNVNGEEKTLDFVIKTHVAVNVLGGIYEDAILNNAITLMSAIPQEKKEKYWNIACKYYEEMGDRLKATKAVYALELITSNF